MHKNNQPEQPLQRGYRHVAQDMRIVLALMEKQLTTTTVQENSLTAALSLRMHQLDQLIGELTSLIEHGDYIAAATAHRQLSNKVGEIPLPQPVPELDARTFSLRSGMKQIALTRVEFQLLQLLVNHPNQIFSRQAIIAAVYGDDKDVTERVIDCHIKKLRQKYKLLFPYHNFIKAVYGLGYSYSQQAD